MMKTFNHEHRLIYRYGPGLGGNDSRSELPPPIRLPDTGANPERERKGVTDDVRARVLDLFSLPESETVTVESITNVLEGLNASEQPQFLAEVLATMPVEAKFDDLRFKVTQMLSLYRQQEELDAISNPDEKRSAMMAMLKQAMGTIRNNLENREKTIKYNGVSTTLGALFDRMQTARQMLEQGVDVSKVEAFLQ